MKHAWWERPVLFVCVNPSPPSAKLRPLATVRKHEFCQGFIMMSASTSATAKGGYMAVGTQLKIVVFRPVSKAYIVPASEESSACALQLRQAAFGIFPATWDRCTCAGSSSRKVSQHSPREATLLRAG